MKWGSIHSAIVFVLVLMTSSQVAAETITDGSLKEIMTLSGLEKQVDQIPELIQAGLMQNRKQGPPISDSDFQKIKKVVLDAFQPSEILVAIEKKMKGSLSEIDAAYLLSWYRSDLGKKITKAEEAATTAKAQQEVMQKMQSLLANEKRLSMAQKIEQAMSVTDNSVELQQQMAVAMFTAVSKTVRPEAADGEIAAFKDQMKRRMDRMRARTQQFILASIIHTHQKGDMDEMEEYVKFLGKPEFKKLSVAYFTGQHTVFVQATKKIDAAFAGTTEKKKRAKVEKKRKDSAAAATSPEKKTQKKSDEKKPEPATPKKQSEIPEIPANYKKSAPVNHDGIGDLELSNRYIEGSDYGVSLSGIGKVKIENCHIVGGTDGVRVSGIVKVTLSNCFISGGVQGISVDGSSKVTLKNCIVQGDLFSIYLDGSGSAVAIDSTFKGKIHKEGMVNDFNDMDNNTFEE